MSDLFDENNENKQNVDEKPAPSMSLDGRREQVEDKINKEMNQSYENEVSGENRFSGVSLNSPYEVDMKSEPKSPYEVTLRKSSENAPQQTNAYTQSTAQSVTSEVSGNSAEKTAIQANNPYNTPRNQPYGQNVRYSQSVNNPQGYVPQQYNQPNVYGSPYGQTTDFTGNAPYNMPRPKRRMNPSLKGFLIIVTSLTVVFTVGFIAECIVDYNKSDGITGLLDDYSSYGNFDNFGDYDDFDSSDNESTDSDIDTETDSESISAWDYWDYFGDYSDDYSDEGSDIDSSESSVNKDIKAAPDSDSVVNKAAANIKVVDQPKDIDTGDYSAKSAYKRIESSVVSIITYDGTVGDENYMDGEGSGIIISEDGYIVTNSHVISDTKSVSVEVLTSDDVSYEAVIVGYDSRTDLAVLKIDAKGLTPAEFVNSDQIEVGQDALAVGSPGGVAYSSSLTRGAVSALNRTVSSNALVSYIQTDAAINPGNSGGPLLNIAGQVMGINTIKIADTDYEGMGFAIPSNTVIEIVNDLISQGYVSNRVRIGIVGTAVGYYYYDDLPSGIQINEFMDDSPFNGTEAKVGDVITAINGEKIEDFTQLYSELDKYQPGDEVTVTLYREKGDETLEVKIKLIADNGETQLD